MVAGAHYVLGAIPRYLGELEAAREHLELTVALFASILHAMALGRLGGLVRSEAKRLANRENGRKGGLVKREDGA